MAKIDYFKKRLILEYSYIQAIDKSFGSDRSPRRGDLVRASVCACVCDIIQNNSENEF